MVSSATAALLVTAKLSMGLLSGSVAVLASAIDSALDLAVSAFNYFAISQSEKPASERFNYGLGKVEGIAATIEGTVIIISGLYILSRAIGKALSGQVTAHLDTSLAIMGLSIVLTAALVAYLDHTARTTGNLVVKADSLHYKTDLYANGGVILSLLLIKLTGVELIDALVGGAIALYIIYSAFEIVRDGVLNLLDVALDDELVGQIRAIIENDPAVESFHDLRTRQAGRTYFIDVHIVFGRKISLVKAHTAADRIESHISALDDTHEWIFNVHLDPVDDSKPRSQAG